MVSFRLDAMVLCSKSQALTSPLQETPSHIEGGLFYDLDLDHASNGLVYVRLPIPPTQPRGYVSGIYSKHDDLLACSFQFMSNGYSLLVQRRLGNSVAYAPALVVVYGLVNLAYRSLVVISAYQR